MERSESFDLHKHSQQNDYEEKTAAAAGDRIDDTIAELLSGFTSEQLIRALEIVIDISGAE